MNKKEISNKGSNDAALIESIAKSFSSEYIGTFTGSEAMDLVEEWIPSTNIAINYALGDPRKGAFPMGRIIELFGPKSSAKSLILYDAGVNVQAMGGIFVLIDSESSFSKPFGKYLGIDFSKFIYAHIRTIEEVTDFIISVIEKIRSRNRECPVLIGWDSLASCTTVKEEEESDEEQKSEMGARARLMSRQMRKVGGLVYRENVTYIVVNQIRRKIGVMFGSPKTTPGGEALPFHASIRCEVTRTKKITRKVAGKRKVIGHGVKVYCDKNKVRPPFTEVEINIYVDRSNMKYGLDRTSGLVDLLESDGIITVSGSMAVLTADTSVRFRLSEIGNHWEDDILPNIPDDLYQSPAKQKEIDSVEESEEDD